MAGGLIHASAPSHVVCAIHDDSQVGAARRRARQVADLGRLDAVLKEHVAIVATELATNMLKHASGGELLIQPIPDESFHGVELIAVDRGPGLPDVARALEDGHSTRGTPGTGLGAARRLSNEFDVFSESGRGTVVLSRIGTTAAASQPVLRVGAIATNAPGEEVCGDQWAISFRGDTASLVMADGLGHGLLALEAASAAVRAFVADDTVSPADFLARAHVTLKSTRGAVVAMARVHLHTTSVTFAGVGNIAGVIIRRDARDQGMVSTNGTVGAESPSIREFSYEWPAGSLLVMHTDGLRTRWSLADRPGLAACHPATIAAVLYRDCLRGRDDATVVVMAR